MTQVHRKRLKVLFKEILLNLKYQIALFFSLFIFYFFVLKIIGFRQKIFLMKLIISTSIDLLMNQLKKYAVRNSGA